MPVEKKRRADKVAPPLRESISKRSDSRQGYSTYVRGFRSVLHHPIGLPLIRYLRSHIQDAGGDDGDEFPLVKELFPDFFAEAGATVAPNDDGSTAADAGAEGGVAGDAAPLQKKRWWRLQRLWKTPRPAGIDDIFNHCHSLWRSGYVRNEAALTSRLAKTMRTELTEYSVTVAGEAPVPDPYTGGTARMDILVSKRMDETGADSPLLVVEVGLNNGLWWTKFDQGMKYLRCMQAFRTSEAALLAVVTVGPGENPTSRLGVFLVTPKMVPEEYEMGVSEEYVDHRVSLLWHEETTGTDNLSNGFGRILRATCKLPQFIAASKAMFDRGAYGYLGPNCCLIKHNNTKLVLRSYDNRACYTERRPDVYLHSGVTGETKIVCDIYTGRAPTDSDFGTRHMSSNTLAWLWKTNRETSSRLLVISTPFREGNHYATKPLDFLPAVEHLEELHAMDYVHGDIRCFNIAMGPDGGLIDFDFGGKLLKRKGETTESLKYPQGYKPGMSDGNRRGRAGAPITKAHDVYALTKVIFGFHHFYPARDSAEPATEKLSNEDVRVEKDSETEALLLWLLELSKFGEPKTSFERLSETEIAEKISSHWAGLKNFLAETEQWKWTVEPTSVLMDELEEHGCIEAGDESTHSRQGTGGATGSPPKKLPKM